MNVINNGDVKVLINKPWYHPFFRDYGWCL